MGDEPRSGQRRSSRLLAWQPSTGYGRLAAAGVGFIFAFSVAAITMLVQVFILRATAAEPLARNGNPWAIAFEVLPWILGAAAGGFVASQLAARGRKSAAALAGILLLLGVTILWMPESRPLSQWLVALAIVILSASFGGWLGCRRAEPYVGRLE